MTEIGTAKSISNATTELTCIGLCHLERTSSQLPSLPVPKSPPLFQQLHLSVHALTNIRTPRELSLC